MRGNELLDRMELIDPSYVEAAEIRPNKKTTRVRWGTAAACFIVIGMAAAAVLPNRLDPQGTISPPASEIHVSMDDIFFNEVNIAPDAARVWRDPEQYDWLQWDRDAVTEYYGKDLTPAYIPDGLTAAADNGTAFVLADKNGSIAEDTLWLGFYHDYYEDGSPKLTEHVAAVQGFSLSASKIGLLHDCLYLLPENEAKPSDIGGTTVTFGHRSMPYGPYDPDTHEPSGYYDMYVADFTFAGIEYQLVAEQMEAEEVVKVVSSIIYGEEVSTDP